jgi:hypothetical protein
MPWVDSEGGPVRRAYLTLFVYSLPTLLVIGAGFFALANDDGRTGRVGFSFFLTSRVRRDPAPTRSRRWSIRHRACAAGTKY